MYAGAKSYSEEDFVSFESIIGIAVSALLLIYLAYALLRPEKF
jgi:K+-transporting ATPase KdpF subunit